MKGGFLIGAPTSREHDLKSIININFFLEHYEEIVAMREQLQMIKAMMSA